MKSYTSKRLSLATRSKEKTKKQKWWHSERPSHCQPSYALQQTNDVKTRKKCRTLISCQPGPWLQWLHELSLLGCSRWALIKKKAYQHTFSWMSASCICSYSRTWHVERSWRYVETDHLCYLTALCFDSHTRTFRCIHRNAVFICQSFADTANSDSSAMLSVRCSSLLR